LTEKFGSEFFFLQIKSRQYGGHTMVMLVIIFLKIVFQTGLDDSISTMQPTCYDFFLKTKISQKIGLNYFFFFFN